LYKKENLGKIEVEDEEGLLGVGDLDVILHLRGSEESQCPFPPSLSLSHVCVSLSL
jgi:hypothetical protein